MSSVAWDGINPWVVRGPHAVVLSLALLLSSSLSGCRVGAEPGASPRAGLLATCGVAASGRLLTYFLPLLPYLPSYSLCLLAYLTYLLTYQLDLLKVLLTYSPCF
jgi:hypothetical protein